MNKLVLNTYDCLGTMINIVKNAVFHIACKPVFHYFALSSQSLNAAAKLWKTSPDFPSDILAMYYLHLIFGKKQA